MNADSRSDLATHAPLAMAYHENSKLMPSTVGYLSETIGEFAGDPQMLRRSITSAKTYPGNDRIMLESVRKSKIKMSLSDALAERRSGRSLSGKPIALADFAALLEAGAGVTAQATSEQAGGLVQRFRAAPSAGALYCVEVYVAALVDGDLKRGLYHFHPEQHALERVPINEPVAAFASCLMEGPLRVDAPSYMILTARWEILLAKYQERGYRLALLEAGHVAENLLLTATALNLAACPLAAFYDDRTSDFLDLNQQEESPLYVIAIGHRD